MLRVLIKKDNSVTLFLEDINEILCDSRVILIEKITHKISKKKNRSY